MRYPERGLRRMKKNQCHVRINSMGIIAVPTSSVNTHYIREKT